ncbi:MAG TPA: hypothetical protein VM328_04000 [Fimbriimonadaceae bacterium]|nr:hypothetical protein [Fimbriimonadaceae bacterium]
MRRFSLLLSTSALLSTLIGCGTSESGGIAGTAAPPAERAVTLRLQPKEGETHTYDATMKMTLGAGEQEMGLDVKMEVVRDVTKVEPGKFTIKESARNVEVSGTGMLGAMAEQMKNNLQSSTATRVYDERNKMIEGDDGAAAAAGAGNFTAIYPEKPVKAGDTWSDTLSAQGTDIKVNYKAEGIEQIAGKDAMKITMDFEPDNAMKFKGPLTFWVDVESGIPHRAEGTITGEQQGQTIKIELSMRKK